MAKKDNLHFAVLSVDTVLFRLKDGLLEVLLMPVMVPEFKGKLCFPGGLIDPKETAREAVERHLENKAGITGCYIEQLYTFSGVDRDPRGRVVSVAHIGLIQEAKSHNVGTGAVWVSTKDVKTLAYDHNDILDVAIERLRNKLSYTTVIRHILPNEFTLTELQEAYESILKRKLDKRNFRKKILSLTIVKETGHMQSGGANRPAALYKWLGSDGGTIEIL